MKKIFRGRLLIKLIFILTLVLLSLNNFLQAATSPDAIAFRVMPNPDHLSPLRWYQNSNFKGAPQALIVDGYEAVRDGRTVYVNAANVNSPDSDDKKFYSNIYIISYNQQAENATIDIFGQILAHWKFNTNLTQEQKEKVRRDTKRLADLADIKIALANYQKAHNGAYPNLSAGSYLNGKTISAWPSWRATFGVALGIAAPLDPINKLGACRADCCKTNSCSSESEADKASCGYAEDTCWNQTTKKFADPSPSDSVFNPPANSRAYVYQYNANGSYNLCALMESGYLTTRQGACPDSVVGHTGPSPQTVGSCGDGIKNGAEQCDGTAGVGAHQSCSSNCTLNNLTYCGDGTRQAVNGEGVTEVCDNGAASATRTQSCSDNFTADLPSYCSGVSILGTQTCKSDCSGWNDCAVNSPTIINGDPKACNSAGSEVNGYACCELISCDGDACGCSGRLNAPNGSGFCNSSNTAPAAECNDTVFSGLSAGYKEIAAQRFSPRCFRTENPPYELTGASCFGIAAETARCTSLKNADPLQNSAFYPLDTWTNQADWLSCRLLQSNSAANSWKVLTNHTWASYRCWR